ncbi:MAG: Nucleoside-triphosphatase THEP1 [Candidatus Methanohalarchaeum thermophilum]|uniref:Nucleoside-triphosphatase THEP1 n=1 Tax=Methanohalarchaeum thermophilum TaxID=1903181 RepID=A0A1Q6DSZ3_METT1|nr:MAG: Nucleoside-triphosphatase THEP1 [Candidatus Methanohalarchaeum thermophilum]
MTDDSEILAHVAKDEGPKVSNYHVDVGNIDLVSKKAINRGLEDANYLVIDEIAPMEVYSQYFKEKTRQALDSNKPLIGVIHQRTSSGFIGKVKSRKDVEIYKIEELNKKTLIEQLLDQIKKDIQKN